MSTLTTRCSVRRLAPLIFLLACTTRDAESVRSADSTSASADSATQARVAAPTSPTAATQGTDATPDHADSGPVSSVEYYPASILNHIADSLSRGSTTGHMIKSHGTFQYLQIRRSASGVPEIHDRWIDVTTVQSGHGTLLSGGTVNGGTLQGGGEHRGGVIVGGTRRPVAPGDLMIIPARTPHQYEIARGDSLRYITVKVLAVPR